MVSQGLSGAVVAKPVPVFSAKNNPSSAIPTGTSYLGVGEMIDALSGTEAEHKMPFSVAGTLRRMRVRWENPIAAGGSFVITVRVGGVDKTLTVTVAAADGADGEKTDTTNSVAVSAGDSVTLSFVGTGNTWTSRVVVGMDFQPSS